MAGHNKWSSIKHKKAKTDAQKGKAFTKVVREIIIAVKESGPDPEANARLRLAIQKAKAVNMPNDNINRAIQKASGQGEDTQLEEIMYEAYATDGVGLIIEVLTDNRNRTLPNIKTIINKAGGSIASKGSVAFQFEKKGLLVTEPNIDQDKIIDLAIDAGAENVDSKDDGSIEITTEPSDFEAVKSHLDTHEVPLSDAAITMIPGNTIEVDIEKAKKILSLIEVLEEDDDVQEVHSNLEITDDLMNTLMQS